jgi:hypothetical protein
MKSIAEEKLLKGRGDSRRFQYTRRGKNEIKFDRGKKFIQTHTKHFIATVPPINNNTSNNAGKKRVEKNFFMLKGKKKNYSVADIVLFVECFNRS